MLQFKIPQNVQRDDQILPFMTMKQLVILCIGGGVSYVSFAFLSKFFFVEIWGPVAFLLMGITIAIAYVKVGGIDFSKWLLLFLEKNFVPQNRIWDNRNSLQANMKAFVVHSPQKSKKTTMAREHDEVGHSKSLKDLVEDVDQSAASLSNPSLAVSHDHTADMDDEEIAKHQKLNNLAEISKLSVEPLINKDPKTALEKIHQEILNKK